MTVQELIDLLEKVEDKEKIVLIDVRQYTRRYGTLCEAWSGGNYLNQVGNAVQINCSLPKNMHTVERKAQ